MADFCFFQSEVCLRRRRPLFAIWHGETSIEGGDGGTGQSRHTWGIFWNLIDP